MPEPPQRQRLDQPRPRLRLPAPDLDPELLGRFSERVARFFGTGKFLAWMTVVVVTWVLVNLFAVGLQWDPYPFILLNLAFSTQASYSAPLILLAQNRQDDRDRIALQEDRARALQTKSDTEYLARELAALRLAIGEVATRDYLRAELDRLRDELPETSSDRTRRWESADSDESGTDGTGPEGARSDGAGSGGAESGGAGPDGKG